jgi:glucokinase
MQGPPRQFAIGCDVGGSNCKSGLVDGGGEVVRRVEFPILDRSDLDTFMSALLHAIDGIVAACPVCGIGVLLPGYLAKNRRVARVMVNLPMLENLALAQLLEERYQVGVRMDIDRNGPAQAEYEFHYRAQASRLLYVTLGTGLGAGMVIDGAICRMTNDSIGEVGHVGMDPDGLPCACGNVGCAETLLSRDGISRIASRLGLCGGISSSVPAVDFPRVLYGAALSGDGGAVQVFEEFGRRLGAALTTYANLFSPDLIVIGGGLSGAAKFFLPVAEAWLNAHWIERKSKTIPVRRTIFGADAGIVGAASLVLHLERITEAKA